MSQLPSLPRPDRRLLLATIFLLSAACKSGKGADDVGGPTAAITLSLNPGSATVAQGGSTLVTGTLTRSGGFTGDVALFFQGAPSTITGQALLHDIGSTSVAEITVLVGPTTPVQTYVVTVIAQAPGVANATAQFTLTVTAAQGYAILGVTPSGGVTLGQATTDNSKTLTITRSNYTAPLALTAEDLPAGLTVSFTPSLTTGNSSALSITASVSVTPGTYNIILRGTGPSSLRAPGGGGGDPANFTAAYTLVVTVTSAGSFTLGITPTGGVTLPQGTTNNSKTVTIARNNYTANVTLTAEGLPSGLTASFAGNPVSGNSSVLTLTASASLAPSTYNITIRGTGPAALRAPDDTANVESNVILAVTVTAGGSFALGITSAGGVTLQQGASDNSKTVTIARNNYAPAVTLTAENLPTGLTAAFAGNPVSGNSSVLTLTAGAGVTPGIYTITILGTGPAALRASGEMASLEATTTLSVTITAAPASGFALGITPAGGATLQQGTSNNTKTVTINRTNYSSNVTLAAENLPAGLTAAFAPNPAGGASATLTLTASGTVAANTYTITIRGTGPSAPDATVTVTVTVTAAPTGSFTLSLTPSASVTLQQGSSDNSRAVGIARTNYTASVTLTAENLPTGLTAAFAPNPASGTSSTLTLTANGTVTPNTYTITIRGTGPAALRAPGNAASVEATVTLTVTVTAPPPSSGNVTVSFEYCPGDKPLFFWAQDGTGPWARIIGSGDRYSFNVFQTKAAFVWKADMKLYVEYRTKAELTASPVLYWCGPPSPTQRNITVTLSGSSDGLDVTFAAFADAGRSWINGVELTLQPTLPGVHDFIAYLHLRGTLPEQDRVAILRDQNPPNGGSLGAVNLATANLLTPATVTVANRLATDLYSTMLYRTGATCDQALIGYDRGVGGTFTAYGIGAGLQRATDFHRLVVRSFSNTHGQRTVEESFHSLGNRTVTLPTPLPVPTVTNLSTTRWRPQFAFTPPAEYQGDVNLIFEVPDGGFGTTMNLVGQVRASYAALTTSGSQVLLSIPDLSGVSGWSDNFLLSGSTYWTLTVVGESGGGSACVEGAKRFYASRQGF